METKVRLQGLNNAISPYDAADGQLATVVNLIPEDEALKPVQTGGTTLFDIGNPSCRIEYIHSAADYKHYIIFCSQDDNGNDNPKYYWADPTGTRHGFSLTGLVANTVTAVGNLLCFVADSGTTYAYWNGTTYIIFTRQLLQYALTIENTSDEFYNAAAKFSGEEFKEMFTTRKAVDSITELSVCVNPQTTYTPNDDSLNSVGTRLWNFEDWEGHIITGIKKTAVREIFNALDADANRHLSESNNNHFKYAVFGVAALRLYDGTHINISNVFILAPRTMPERVEYGYERLSSTENSFATSLSLHSHNVKVEFNNAAINDIIQGVDIFLTPDRPLIDFDLVPALYQGDLDPTQIDAQTAYTFGHFNLCYYGEKELYPTFDDLPFYHSVFVSKDDFGSFVPIKPSSQTNTHLSLASFQRETLGAKTAYTYNNRLHLANVLQQYVSPLSIYPKYKFDIASQSPGRTSATGNALFGFILDNGNSESGSDWSAVFVVYGDENTQPLYYSATIQYPLPPIVMVPGNASKMDIYIYSLTGTYKKTVQLTRSSSSGMSYFLSTKLSKNNTTQLFFMQHRDLGSGYQDNGTWETITQVEFAGAYTLSQSSQAPKLLPNVIKLSEAENPLVFPPANTVAVGNSAIVALSSNTEPITEGQFGVAPLYAFTQEGIWALTVSDTGTYSARQPVSRDILKSAKSVTPINNMVLFTTNRGIMAIQGSRVICLSEQISGTPFLFTTMPQAATILQSQQIPAAAVTYVDFRSLFLQDARILFDYPQQRLIVFNPAYGYTYVYSMKSGQWGAAINNDYVDTVPSYQSPMVVMLVGDRHVVAAVTQEVVNIPVMLCTRPLKLDNPNVHKTVLQSILRGMFRADEIALALYGSNDLYNWFVVSSSVNAEINAKAGSPYKFFRLAAVGQLSAGQSISEISASILTRLNNKIR